MKSQQQALAGFALAAACALWLALAISSVSAQTSRSDSANSYVERGSSWLSTVADATWKKFTSTMG